MRLANLMAEMATKIDLGFRYVASRIFFGGARANFGCKMFFVYSGDYIVCNTDIILFGLFFGTTV